MRLLNAIKSIWQFHVFKKEIKEEIQNPDSTFNKLNLHVNKLGNVIYVQLNYDDEKFMSSGYNVQNMVGKDLDKINSYLDNDIRWGEFLEQKISQFYDEDGFPTYSYAIEYKFVDYLDAIKYILKVLGICICVSAFIIGIIEGFIIIYQSTI
jgi:hypothetical protein